MAASSSASPVKCSPAGSFGASNPPAPMPMADGCGGSDERWLEPRSAVRDRASSRSESPSQLPPEPSLDEASDCDSDLRTTRDGVRVSRAGPDPSSGAHLRPACRRLHCALLLTNRADEQNLQRRRPHNQAARAELADGAEGGDPGPV